MVSYKDFEVTININGVPCIEYEHDHERNVIPHEDSKTRVCYIEAVTGADFTIFHSAKRSLGALKRSEAVSIEVIIDGEVQTIALAQKKNNFTTVIKGRDFRKKGEQYGQQFFFDKLLTDDGSIPIDSEISAFEKNSATLGTIEVNIYRLSRATKGISLQTVIRDRARVNQDVIKEEILKRDLRTHRVSFGRPKVRRNHKFYNAKYIDQHGQPHLSFRFLYRSKASLAALGLRAPVLGNTQENPILIDAE